MHAGSLEDNGFDHAAGRSKEDNEEEGDDSDGEEEEEELSDLFSKLNPHAKEFVPLSHSDGDGDGDRRGGGDGCSPDADNDSKTNRKVSLSHCVIQFVRSLLITIDGNKWAMNLRFVSVLAYRFMIFNQMDHHELSDLKWMTVCSIQSYFFSMLFIHSIHFHQMDIEYIYI